MTTLPPLCINDVSGLLQAKDYLELALEAGKSGTWAWDMLRNVTQVSTSYREMFALPSETPVTYEVWLERVHPADRERCARYGAGFFRGNETEWRLDFRVLLPDGDTRWQRAVGKLYRGLDGQPKYFMGVTTDVTEEQKAIAALRESEERFRTMADGLPLIVWVHDAEGKQQFVNRTFREYFGVTDTEMKDERWTLLMHPDDAPGYAAEFIRCVRERSAFHAETRVKDGSGEWRVIESWARPRFSAGGEFLGLVGTSADITERRDMERAQREADRRKDEFLAMLGHELRNPLAAITAATAVIRQRVPHDPVLEQIVAASERQTAILKRLVDDLLDSARIATGKINLQREVISLRDVADAAIEMNRPRLKARQHTLVVEDTSAELPVFGDRFRLTQVVANLVANAAKYTPEGGRIELRLERSGNTAVLRVRDNGIGIPPSDIQTVFGLFFQGSHTASVDRRGLGLGLSIVKRLVELHEGSVEAKSEGAGRGSEFVVRLPICAIEAPLSQPESAVGAVVSSRICRRVMVVDDNEDAAMSIAELLSALGHETRVAYDGSTAIELAKHFCPELVILDIGLPDIDGYEVARRLRSGRRGADLCIVAASGYPPRLDDETVQLAGIDRYFLKPVDVAQLTALELLQE